MIALAIDSFAQRAPKREFGPLTDAGLQIRRDVRRIDHAERRPDGAPAREHPAAARGMTDIAVTNHCEVRAVRDLGGIECAGGGRLDRMDRRARSPRREDGEEHQQDQHRPENCAHGTQTTQRRHDRDKR